MKASFITDKNFQDFVATMIRAVPTYGPVAKRTRFAFARLESADELRLDYDVTILPPKKLFFPPAQDLLRFDGTRFGACLEPEQKVLFGVHFYDVKAIDQTDLLFTERNQDVNYLAHRKTTTIVASSVQNVSKRAFFASVGTEAKPKGHDAFLTKVSGGYVFETLTPAGEALLAHGKFTAATDSQAGEAKKVNDEVLKKCPETLQHSSAAVAQKTRAAFGKEELWKELATDCFSCGSCNTVCPTCYCFDVQDTWNVDQKSGLRTRYWDACLTEDFAKISLGAGATENFREEPGERFRHRIMRKAAYLNQKLGGPACVGCGRCSSACTADIADPVRVISRIMES
jgi:sulfhydrogenase subunit beta (sulfur reductase)